VARRDLKCARFEYGIYPNPDFSGQFNFGADIQFRRWAKLQTPLHGKSLTLRTHRALSFLDRRLTQMVNLVADALQPINPKRRLNGALVLFRNAVLQRLFRGHPEEPYDQFVLECFSPQETAFQLMMEHHAGDYRLRHSFCICPGWNLLTLPAEQFRLDVPGMIMLWPENSEERRLIFTWLDFVQFKSGLGLATAPTTPGLHAAKVKCVAWDLDNTLWQGTLAEAREEELRVRDDVVDIIRKIDQRGIIQTVVSKNNFEDAWRVVERLQLRDYFLHPAINWAPKSQNLENIAKNLNISLDTFALVDDSAFERAEVQNSLPQVRTYSIEQIPGLLGLAEFDVPVTQASQQRRASYLTEIERDREKKTYAGNYEAFLRSCKMKLRIFVPRDEAHVLRCLELIQRANQLNLSNKRYSSDEFHSLLSTPAILCLALDCRDRFGEYGIVGFVAIDERQSIPVIRDMVLSCRVAQKQVEHTFLEWLANYEAERGMKVLRAQLSPTERNAPLLQAFKDIPFSVIDDQGAGRLVELPLKAPISERNILAIETEDFHPLPKVLK